MASERTGCVPGEAELSRWHQPDLGPFLADHLRAHIMALDHIGGGLVDLAAVRLVDADRDDNLGGTVLCAPLRGRDGPVEVAVDQLGDRRDRFVLAVGGVQRIQFLAGQVPGLAVAVQRMGLGPHLLHVDARRFVHQRVLPVASRRKRSSFTLANRMVRRA